MQGRSTIQMKRISILLIFFVVLPLHAFGTYGEGRAYVVLRELGSKGVIFTSYEGLFEIATYDENEACVSDEQCYTPQKVTIPFSVRIENKQTIQFLQKNIDRLMLIEYRIHRIKPIALSTSFEVLNAFGVAVNHGPDFPWKFVSRKTGSAETSLFGKVLRLEYQGMVVGTYEGILYDRRLDKIRPFSVTDENMARHIWRCMEAQPEYNIGLSRALVKGLRSSKYDVFEINYHERANSVE